LPPPVPVPVGAAPAMGEMPTAYESTAPVHAVAPLMAYAPAPAPPVPTAWMGWAAIVLTSALFAVVHPLWTSPIIFFLSLGLGYVYERTGNLWAPMGLHAAFNVLSVVLYLAQVS
jgi:hypothetical protein